MENKNFIAINADNGNFQICQAENKAQAINIFLKSLNLMSDNYIVLPFGNCLNENENSVKIEIKTVYKYDELTEDQKSKVLEKQADINIDYDWWEFIYEDAERIGIKITEFDIDRVKIEIKQNSSLSCYEITDKILKEHGKDCNTYQLAGIFQKDWDQLVIDHSDGIDLSRVAVEKENEFDKKADKLEKEFLYNLKYEYLSMLKKEYEYNISREAIEETIKAKEYKFDEYGNIQ